MVQSGTVLLNKYRIDRLLGEGGMGVVALAHHLQLDQPVAIKFLREEVLGNHQVVQRFLREAQAAVRLKSEHVCQVYDVGTLETGSPYMVMEYMEGMDLGDWMRQGRPEPGVAVDFMLQACEALAEAHALGIVHRDIKPSNFFLTRRGDGSPLLKVLDFGISKAPSSVDMDLTNTKAVMGTPAYMSPEQMRSSKQVDGRTDVWSLGVVLYELLSGQRPFKADTFSALCLQVAMDPTPPLEVPLPGELGAVVERCLEKDLSRRFQNMAELAASLAPYAQSPAQAANTTERTARVLGVAPGAAPARASTAGDVTGVPTVLSTLGEEQEDPPGRRVWLIAAVAAVVVAAGIGIMMGVGGSSGAGGSGGEPAASSASAVEAEEAEEAEAAEAAEEPDEVEEPAVDPTEAEASAAGAAGAEQADDSSAEAAGDEMQAAAVDGAGAGEAADEERAGDEASRRAARKRREREAREASRDRSKRKKRRRRKKRSTESDESMDDIFGTRQ